MLRPVPIKHYLDVMRAKGFRDADLLASTVIDASSLENHDYLIDHSDHQTFLANMIRLSGDQGLGLELGLTNEAAHFGILAYAGLSCRTIRHGMEDIWTRYGNAFGVTTRLTVVSENAKTAVVEIFTPQVNEPIYRFSVEEALCVLLKIGGSVTGVEPPFERMEFSYPKPGYGDRYRDIFHCPVRFDAVRTCVTIKRSWLDSPLKTNDVELNRVCREHLDRVLKQAEAASPTTLRLRHLLMSQIDNLPSIGAAAHEFGMSSRTLARQLRREGYTFRQLSEELRCELAQSWLRSSRMSTKEIGFQLGFRDVAAFRRAFKGWTGQTVSEYCAAVGAAPRHSETLQAA